MQEAADELLHLARGGQFVQALRYWATACRALYQIEGPASDDFGLFDNYGADVLNQWYAVLATAGWPAALLAAVLPPTELAAGFETSWQPLLLALAADAAAAPLLPQLLTQTALGTAAEGPLHLRLAQTLADDAAWAQAAETLLPTDAPVAQQLLNFYNS